MFPFLFLVYFTCFVDKEDFDIPQVTILYITEYNALNYNQAVTHVKRCIKTVDDYAKSYAKNYAISYGQQCRAEERLDSIRNMIEFGLTKEQILRKYSEEEYEKAEQSMLTNA